MLQQHGKAKIYLLISLLITGCSTTDTPETKEGLDVSSGDAIEIEAEALPTAPPTESKDKDKSEFNMRSGIMSGHAIFDWQKFFMVQPNPEQRSILKEKITAWKDNSTAEELTKKAKAELVLGQEAAAEADLRTALRLDGSNTEALLQLAQLYIQTKNSVRAFEHLSQLKRLLDKQPRQDRQLVFRYRYALALGLIGRSDLEGGRSILSDLIAVEPGFLPGYAALATSYLHTNKLDIAEFVAKRGLDRGKDDAALLNILGVVAQNRQRELAARDYFNKAVAINPNFTPALINRANMALQSHELQAAEADLMAAVNTSPNDPMAQTSLGICLRRMGRFKAAEVAFQRAIDIDPDHAAARYNLALMMAGELKKPNQALRLFHEVLQTRDENQEIKQLARIHIEDIQENRLTDEQSGLRR